MGCTQPVAVQYTPGGLCPSRGLEGAQTPCTCKVANCSADSKQAGAASMFTSKAPRSSHTRQPLAPDHRAVQTENILDFRRRSARYQQRNIVGAQKHLIQSGEVMVYIDGVGYGSAALFHHMGQSLLPEHVDIVATEKVALAVEVNAELRLRQGTGMLRRVGGGSVQADFLGAEIHEVDRPSNCN